MPVYVQMPDVTGSATDTNHKGWVQANTTSWGAGRNVKFATGANGNREGASISFGEVEISKQMDGGSFAIAKAFWNKKSLATVTVDICRQGAGSGDVSILKYELSDVLLSGYATWSDGNNVPMERFSMNYSKFQETVTDTPDDNNSGQPAVTGYDLKENSII